MKSLLHWKHKNSYSFYFCLTRNSHVKKLLICNLASRSKFMNHGLKSQKLGSIMASYKMWTGLVERSETKHYYKRLTASICFKTWFIYWPWQVKIQGQRSSTKKSDTSFWCDLPLYKIWSLLDWKHINSYSPDTK